MKAESAYLDMDVGNMVVNNSAFFDLKIDVTVLFTCLTVSLWSYEVMNRILND